MKTLALSVRAADAVDYDEVLVQELDESDLIEISAITGQDDLDDEVTQVANAYVELEIVIDESDEDDEVTQVNIVLGTDMDHSTKVMTIGEWIAKLGSESTHAGRFPITLDA